MGRLYRSGGRAARGYVDKIILSNIEIYAYGGVTEAERAVGQRYRVDVEMSLDLTVPGRSDDVEDTVSYADVHRLVVDAMRERPFRLLESVAARIANEILERFAVDAVTLRVAKLLPPIDGVVASAAVEVTRKRL